MSCLLKLFTHIMCSRHTHTHPQILHNQSSFLLYYNSAVREQLPIVYVYDHCPFCVRVRLAMGVKNVKHLIHFLANDDVDTPTALVGKKIAPIFVSLYIMCIVHVFICNISIHSYVIRAALCYALLPFAISIDAHLHNLPSLSLYNQ